MLVHIEVGVVPNVVVVKVMIDKISNVKEVTCNVDVNLIKIEAVDAKIEDDYNNKIVDASNDKDWNSQDTITKWNSIILRHSRKKKNIKSRHFLLWSHNIT